MADGGGGPNIITLNMKLENHTHSRCVPIWTICLLATLFRVIPVDAEDEIDFARDIQPILNAKCTGCHGGVKAAGGVSFIYENQVVNFEGDSGMPVVTPGDLEESEMIYRITTSDEDERMPPPDDHPEGLEANEIELIKRWVKQGAKWSGHWAFTKPRAQERPTVKMGEWPKKRSDYFILSQLESEGLSPSRAADPPQWLRRASIDLTGLPPTLEELDTFNQTVTNKGADIAYQEAVDRLLASSHFGERWAQMWMDLVRYADTQGFEKDNGRTVWPYRDWLIRAFNDDLPYDQFTIKQIAGDLLPDRTVDDLVATVCHRNTQTNAEGGTDDEEFRVAAVIDRMSTTWTVWQGVTFGCVQCHSHPYDPIRHEEFYQFMSFFNNSEDADLNDDYPVLNYPKDHEQRQKAFDLYEQIASLRESLNEPGRVLGLDKDLVWETPEDLTLAANRGTIHLAKDGLIRTGGTADSDLVLEVSFPAKTVTSFRLRILPESDDPAKWPERGSVATQFWVTLKLPDGTEKRLPLTEVFADTLAGPYDPMDSLKAGGRGFGGYPKLFGPRWAVFVLKESLTPPEGAVFRVSIGNRASTTGNQMTPLRRFAIETNSDPRWAEIAAAPDRAANWKRHSKLLANQKAIPSVSIPVMVERPSAGARETRQFIRGNWIEKDKAVEAGTPGVFHPLPPGKADRVALANWLVHPDNALTSRIFVNRIWSHLFGIGIVETLEDMGSTGEQPSHPELLDDLAVRFQSEMGWSLKTLLRELVLSSAYRQDHGTTPELLEADPRNRLLARGPRTRLSAEMIRDQALTVSGLLSRKAYGPPVMPPQPAGIWAGAFGGGKWENSTGEDRYRRAVYTYWKRTSPYPSFLTFDAPAREICSARRIATNTPLQPLITLNDPVFLECSKVLAKRMDEEGGEVIADKMAKGYLLITLRQPDETVLAELTNLYRDVLAELKSDFTDDSKSLGATPHAAALTLTASALLNLDTVLTK